MKTRDIPDVSALTAAFERAFDDELIRTAGGWKFRRRKLTVDQDFS